MKTSEFLSTVAQAIKDIQQGKMVIIIDDKSRENEGDFVIAAEKITPEAINFMAKYGRGLICMPMSASIVERLGLKMMVSHNQSKQGTPFTVSIGARSGISTGISAFDRARTVQVAVAEGSTAADICSPGHIFPLQATEGGIFVRRGHTEASVDLVCLAGLKPAAVVCEIMNEDGTMARLPELQRIAAAEKLTLISVADILKYRIANEKLVECTAKANLPLKGYGNFEVRVFQHRFDSSEYIVLINDKYTNPELPPLVRIHSQCMTGDIFGSIRCDCRWQLEYSLEKIAAQGGVLIYLNQEGRGIGLANKIKAYSLQEQGLDTVEANQSLGFSADQRDYHMAVQTLKALNLKKIRLLTNNPQKLEEIQSFGIEVVKREPVESEPTEDNLRYLQTKREKLGHLLSY